MKFYTDLLKKLNNNGKVKGFKLIKNNKYITVAKSSVVALALAFSLTSVGCKKNDEIVPNETDTSTITTEDVTTEPTVETDDFEILADQIVGDVTMNDNLTEKVEDGLNSSLDTSKPNEDYNSPSDIFIAPDGSAWVSKEAYDEFVKNNSSNNPVTEGYLAPDGNVWENEQAYLDYIASQKESSSGVEDNFYKAPDGTIWTSQEEYEKYISGNPENSDMPAENDSVVEDGYKAPDGTIWSSEQDYFSYIKGFDNVDNSNTNTGASGDRIDAYYFAPDGTVWESEEAYLKFIDSNNQSSETTTSDESSSVAVVPESEYEEPLKTETLDMSEYYQDEYGNWWASYEDYLLFKEYESELTK